MYLQNAANSVANEMTVSQSVPKTQAFDPTVLVTIINTIVSALSSLMQNCPWFPVPGPAPAPAPASESMLTIIHNPNMYNRYRLWGYVKAHTTQTNGTVSLLALRNQIYNSLILHGKSITLEQLQGMCIESCKQIG